jgi:hypothetical protein
MDFWKRRRKGKLYKQWVKRSGLPSEAVHPEAAKPEDVPLEVQTSKAGRAEEPEPLRVHIEPGSGVVTHPEVAGDMMAEIRKRQPRLRALYLLLVVAVVILFVGLILLIVNSC